MFDFTELRRTLQIEPDRFNDLELIFIDWLYQRSQRRMAIGWEGYYVWIHKNVPLYGYDFGEVEQSIILDGRFKTTESIALYIILDWNRWNRLGNDGWRAYWLSLMNTIYHLIRPLKEGDINAEEMGWQIILQRILTDWAYYVPAGLFEAKTPFRTISRGASASHQIEPDQSIDTDD